MHAAWCVPVDSIAEQQVQLQRGRPGPMLTVPVGEGLNGRHLDE